jgi:hypothetical protein
LKLVDKIRLKAEREIALLEKFGNDDVQFIEKDIMFLKPVKSMDEVMLQFKRLGSNPGIGDSYPAMDMTAIPADFGNFKAVGYIL